MQSNPARHDEGAVPHINEINSSQWTVRIGLFFLNVFFAGCCCGAFREGFVDPAGSARVFFFIIQVLLLLTSKKIKK